MAPEGLVAGRKLREDALEPDMFGSQLTYEETGMLPNVSNGHSQESADAMFSFRRNVPSPQPKRGCLAKPLYLLHIFIRSAHDDNASVTTTLTKTPPHWRRPAPLQEMI